MKKTLRPSGGHILDIDAAETGDQFLSLAHNVNTRKGFPSRIGGRRIAYPVSAGGAPTDPYHLLNLSLNTFNWWMHFGTDEIFAVESSNSHDISYASQIAITNPHEWVSTLLNGIPVFTNGKNPLLYWDGDGSNAAVEVPDWPASTICRAVVAFRYHLFALNIDSPDGTFENLILWSDAAEPGTLPASWTPAADNEAGSTAIADTPGRCIIGRPLTQQLIIYKPQSAYAVEYLGQQPDRIFDVRPIVRSVGTLAPHCVAELILRGPQHFVVGNDDVTLFDGVNVTSIAENRIKTFLANSIDAENAQNCFVVPDMNKREVWVCVPEGGEQFPTIAHIWDIRRDTWVTRDLNRVRYGTTGYVQDTAVDDTWDADSETWDSDLGVWNATTFGGSARVVIAEEDVIYLEDAGTATEIVARLAKYDMDFGDDTQRKVTNRVHINGSGDGFASLRFRMGTRQATHLPITWSAYADYQAGGRPYEVEGRYISIEVEGTTVDPWTVNRIQIEANYSGPY